MNKSKRTKNFRPKVKESEITKTIIGAKSSFSRPAV